MSNFVEVMADEHQAVLEFLERLLALFVDIKKAGKVRIAPFEVKLWPDGPSREPDIIFVNEEGLSRFDSKRFVGAPNLVVEIISPSSLYIDRNDKFREYEQAGVEEYWLIDSRPSHRRVDVFHLGEDRRYQLVATEVDAKLYSNLLPYFYLRPEWLWDNTSPLQALGEILGAEEIMAALFKKDLPRSN